MSRWTEQARQVARRGRARVARGLGQGLSRRVKRGAKRVLRRSEPQELTPWQDLLHEFQVDARRYYRYSVPRGGGSERFDVLTGMQLDAAATRHNHRVEKGFAMPETKRPFGKVAVPSLTRVVANADSAGDALFAAEAKEVLEALAQWNDHGVRDERLAPRGDALPVNPLDAEAAAAFLTSRRSVRSFAPQPVDRALVTEAVRQASYAPSVCNRQGFRAYYFDDPADIARILSAHSGSAGFADGVPALFVVTYDLRVFQDTFERNQGWIDGGLFAMTLLLALHGLGLGAVPLNWSRRNRASRRLRRLAAIPDHDNIVMLIATGHPAEGYRVARSSRRPVSQLLRIGMPPG